MLVSDQKWYIEGIFYAQEDLIALAGRIRHQGELVTLDRSSHVEGLVLISERCGVRLVVAVDVDVHALGWFNGDT